MTLRSRYTLFTVFWLILILLLYNIFVYFLVIKVTTRSEMQLLASKTDLVVESLHKNKLANLKDPKLLSDLYNANEIIRVVAKDSEVLNSVGYDKELMSITPVVGNVVRSDTVHISRQRVIIYSEPIYQGDVLIGVVEGIRRLTVLDSYLQILIGTLSVTSIGAVVFAIFGTYWFTSRLTGPISQMVQTMREIDRSGVLHKVKMGREESVELQQLIRAFNQMIDRIDRNIERQKQFVADASHELKTPLTVIGSYADMLKRWGRDDEAIRNEAVEAIAQETERLKRMTRSMLMLAEAEQDDWLHKSRFDVVQVVQELANVLGTTFQRDIRVHHPGGSAAMVGDKDKIRQLLQILIDNAIKYSKEPIDVRIRFVRSMVRIEVTDYGIGVPESEIPYLFERFYRVDEARHRTTGGSGLGLAIAKKIVDLHEGTVEVFSKQGNGTTIILQFPRHLHSS